MKSGVRKSKAKLREKRTGGNKGVKKIDHVHVLASVLPYKFFLVSLSILQKEPRNLIQITMNLKFEIGIGTIKNFLSTNIEYHIVLPS